MYDLFRKRSRDFTIGLMEDERMSQSVIPYWETKNKKITKLELLPLSLAMRGKKSGIGLPCVAEDTAFMNTLADLSAPFGVTVKPAGHSLFTCEW